MPNTTKVRQDVYVRGNVKNDDAYLRNYYNQNEATLIKAFDECKKIFDCEDVKHLHLLIRNIRGNVVGNYNNTHKCISIDLRRYNLKSIVSTIIHEMTHCQQYKLGKLSKDTSTTSNWNDKKIKCKNISHQQYLDLPWEIEAREMQKKYIDQVMKAIK
jgi:hypothetical protein